MSNKVDFRVVGLLSAVLVSSISNADYVFVDLHQTGYQSTATSLSGGNQFGYILLVPSSNDYRAAKWSGSAGTYESMAPTPSTNSQILGSDGAFQIGYSSVSGTPHAGFWTGTATSFVDIHPVGYYQSFARAVKGNQQVGSAYQTSNSDSQGIVWNGTSSSAINVHPTNYKNSNLNATNGVQQGGYATPNGGSASHAGLWTGTATSFVDMNPIGAGGSFVTAMSATLQGGFATFGGVSRAYLWQGSQASAFSLHPTGASTSTIQGMNATNQVGSANFPSNNGSHAMLWAGTATNYLDLHSYLPSNYTFSSANSIDEFGNIVGVAGNNDFRHAVMWVNVVPEPTTLAFLGLVLLQFLKKRKN